MPSPFSLGFCQGSNVIFLVRDPRAVVVSYYHELVDRRRLYRGPLTQFIRDPALGIAHILRFLNFLVGERDRLDDLVISYEDLHRHAAGELARMLEFSGTSVDAAALKDSVRFAEFANMRRLEQSGQFGEQLSPTRASNPDSYKVRKGSVDWYREELSPDDLAYLDEEIRQGLSTTYGAPAWSRAV